MAELIIYGLGCAQENYRVIRYQTVFTGQKDLIREVNYETRRMYTMYGATMVYVIDNRRGLCREYRDACKINSMEGWAMFKDILEREGVLWPV